MQTVSNWNNVNKIVLGAKMMDRECFQQLSIMHKFIIEQINAAFCEKCDFLNHQKYEIYELFHRWFWDEIREYDFENEFSFSYCLKKNMIEKMNLYIKTNRYYFIYKELSYEDVNEYINRTNKQKRKDRIVKRKKLTKAFVTLTPKQLQILIMNRYQRITKWNCFKKLGISDVAVEFRISHCMKKLSETYWGVKTNKKEPTERIYGIYIIRKNGVKDNVNLQEKTS